MSKEDLDRGLAGAVARRLAKVAPIGAVCVLAFSPTARGASQCGIHPWCNSRLTPEARATALLQAMTRDEKLELVASGKSGIARLQIPPLAFIDGPNGIGEGSTGVTAFPDAETIAASWNPAVARAYGTALGAEAAGKGDTLLAAPTINIVRTPKWGREAETLGEDPFLTSTLVAPEILGIESQHVIAQVKHFAGYNQEVDRFGDPLAASAVSDQVSARALHEIYFPGFEAALKRGHAASVMCSYNRINGVYSCQDPATLGALKAAGLTGFVGPDAILAVRDDVAAANAGVDNFQLGSLSTATGGSNLPILKAAVSDGRISAPRLDAMTRRVLTAMFAIGLFDHRPLGGPRRTVSTQAHLALATRIAEQATVLLKNRDQVLPLSQRDGTVAVIGADAGVATQIEENGSPAVLHGPVITPLQAIRARAAGRRRVNYAQGTRGVVPLTVIPSTVLKPRSGGGQGLSATYYGATDRSGSPLLSRVDRTIDFQSAPAPLTAIPGTRAYSAEWLGTLTPPTTGRYRFSLAVAGAARLYIDGHLVVRGDAEFYRADLPGGIVKDPGGPIIAFQGSANLARGRPVSIRVDYSTASSIAGAGLHLGWQPPEPALLARAVGAARHARVAIVFANDVTSEGMDRTSLELPGDQDRLIEAVAAANPRTVVVLHTAGPVLMPWLSKVAAVLEAWYPGQESGAAIASTLFGDSDPSGRLPVTFPASASQGPATNPSEYPGIANTANYDEGIFVGYRYYDRVRQRPLFPFGYGLSYTSFSFGRARVQARGQGRYAVSVSVSNTGRRAGDSVVELYISSPAAAREAPDQLKGFAKVHLDPGQTRTVTLQLDSSSFSTWSTSRGAWTIVPGKYGIHVGSSSRSLPTWVTIRIP